MQRLAEQREEEQREMERKRKEEWTRKRRVELEGQRDWEKKSLHSLRVQHSQLEDQLRQLDQRKITVEASTHRQKSMYSQILLDIKTMRLSHDVRRAELTKLQSELNVSSSCCSKYMYCTFQIWLSMSGVLTEYNRSSSIEEDFRRTWTTNLNLQMPIKLHNAAQLIVHPACLLCPTH